MGSTAIIIVNKMQIDFNATFALQYCNYNDGESLKKPPNNPTRNF